MHRLLFVMPLALVNIQLPPESLAVEIPSNPFLRSGKPDWPGDPALDPPNSRNARGYQVSLEDLHGTALPPPAGWTPQEFLDAQPLSPASFGPASSLPPALAPPQHLTEHKSGFFQRASLGESWLVGGGQQGLGIHEIEASLIVALPMPTTDWPMLITSAFNLTLVDGPRAPDLPAELFETSLDFTWLPRPHDRWLFILAVSPGIYSDFNSADRDALRVLGKGLVRWDWIPERLQILMGVLYLDRSDVNLLPAGGFIWTPNENLRYELVFPRPKLAHRISWKPGRERWAYLKGEFGGDAWSIESRDGTRDNVILRDWRLALGIEQKQKGGAGFRFEVGYVFSRSLEYESTTPDYRPEDTIMLRAGFSI